MLVVMMVVCTSWYLVCLDVLFCVGCEKGGETLVEKG